MSSTEFEFIINLIGGTDLSERHNVQESHSCSRKVGTDAKFSRKWWVLRYGRKELLWKASFGFAFLWTIKKLRTYCFAKTNEPSGTRALRCPTPDNKSQNRDHVRLCHTSFWCCVVCCVSVIRCLCGGYVHSVFPSPPPPPCYLLDRTADLVPVICYSFINQARVNKCQCVI
jgi:hypothetical protein